jgi:hypothetical protein
VTLPRSRIVLATICCNSAAFTAWGRLLIQHRDLRTQIEFLARVATQLGGEPNRAIAALQKLFSIPYASHGALLSILYDIYCLMLWSQRMSR